MEEKTTVNSDVETKRGINAEAEGKDNKKKFFNSRPLFYAFLSLMLAIATSKFIFDGNIRYIVFDVVILLVFFGYCIWARSFKTLAVVLSVFMFGLGWFFAGVAVFEGKTYSDEVTIYGRISDDISYSDYGGSARVILKDVEIDGQSAGNIYLTLNFDSEDDFQIGDEIMFVSRVEKVKLFTLGNFNSQYYRKRTPYACEVDAKDVVVQGNCITWDESFRLEIKETLNQHMGEREGAVAYAVIFGDKSGVEDEIYDAYNSAGIIHLLTVSGLHVSFLIALLGWTLKKIRIRGIWNFLLCFAFLLLYASLCNFSPSILRAGLMGLVLFSTQLCGKCYDSLNSLGFAGLIILLFMPLSALDLGFLMSFFCVLGIYIISPWVKKILQTFLPKCVANSFAISIGATVAILPFVARMYGGVVLLGFFVNLLVVPFFGVLFPYVVVCALLCTFLPFLGFTLQVGGWGFRLIEIVADFFGQTQLSVDVQPFDIFFVATLFLGFFLLSKFFMASKKRKAICCSTVFALSGIFCGLSFVQFPVQSSVVYAQNYSNSVVVLTNSAGESVIVDFGYENFTRDLLNALEIKNISTAFVLQKPTIYNNTANMIGVDTIIRCDEGQGYDEETLVELNQPGTVGGFSFVFRGNRGRLTGLEISFDDTTVFILKDWTTSDEALDALPVSTYDFVILGEQDECASHFSSESVVLTRYDCATADFSFEKSGNISFQIDGNNFSRRCLD